MRWRGGRGRRRSSGIRLVRDYSAGPRAKWLEACYTYDGNYAVRPQQGGEIGEEFEGE